MKCMIFSISMFLSFFIQVNAIDLNQPLNTESFNKWREYIIEKAPSDSALRVVFHIAKLHSNYGAWAKSRETYKYFYPYFQSRKEIFIREIRECEEKMAEFISSLELFPLYNDAIKSRAPDEIAFLLVNRLAEHFTRQKKYDSAAIIYEFNQSYFPDKKLYFSKIIDLLKRTEDSLIIEPLKEINTHYDEWDPCPTPDGKKIFFSSRRNSDSWGGADVMTADINNGIFENIRNIGPDINTNRDETIDNISADGQIACLSGEFANGEGLFDIVFAVKDSNGWSKLYRPLGAINTPYQDESGCLSADGKVLIFSSDRPGGVGEFHPYGKSYRGNSNGNMDIYVSIREKDGWGKPINLGKMINTPYAERSAYLHPDGKTLYFSSNGHYNLGGMDVFKSVRLSDTSWTEWSEPINLGKQINSAIDDWGYKISSNGDKAYFSAMNRKGGKGGWDLFSIELPKFAQPNKIVRVKGKVLDENNKPISVKIKWENLENSDFCGESNSDPETGDFFIALSYGANYGYYAEKEGYYPTANNIDLRKKSVGEELNKTIILHNIKRMAVKGERIAANNIFFDENKSELKKESYSELNRLLSIIKHNNRFVLEIAGHTDSIGTDRANYELSLRRAQAVADYLISKGADKTKIIIKGYGSAIPIAPNDNSENKSKNRRVELRFIE